MFKKHSLNSCVERLRVNIQRCLICSLLTIGFATSGLTSNSMLNTKRTKYDKTKQTTVLWLVYETTEHKQSNTTCLTQHKLKHNVYDTAMIKQKHTYIRKTNINTTRIHIKTHNSQLVLEPFVFIWSRHTKTYPIYQAVNTTMSESVREHQLNKNKQQM